MKLLEVAGMALAFVVLSRSAAFPALAGMLAERREASAVAEAGRFSGLASARDSAIDLIREGAARPNIPLSLRLLPGSETVELGVGDFPLAGLVLDSGGVFLDGNNAPSNAGSPAEVIIDGGGRIVALTPQRTAPLPWPGWNPRWDAAAENNFPLITVGNGVALTLKNIALQGIGENKQALVKVLAGGRLILEEGAALGGNVAAGGNTAGGVCVEGGELIMHGGAISGNRIRDGGETYGGGGVAVFGGVFAMNGGAVSGNGGENFYDGGGVYVEDGIFVMRGGSISGNTGAGVALWGAFIMEGGAISGNGGGVLACPGAVFSKRGGIIYGSNAEAGLQNTAERRPGHAVAAYEYAADYQQYSLARHRDRTAGPELGADDPGFWEEQAHGMDK